MDLSKVFSSVVPKFGQKEEVLDRYLAIKISLTSVSSAVWAVENGRVQIGKVASAQVGTDNFDHLLRATDQAVSEASADYPNITKAIFAVPLETINDGKIVPEELTKLRKLCKELDLVPLGYVVIADALQEYFKETEGAPLSAILVGLDGKKVSLTLVKAGKEIGSETLERENGATLSVAAEIEKGLKQMGHMEGLPSRIILYDGDSDLSQVANEITAYPWTGRLPFLHFPKVEKVSTEFVVNAVAGAGGLQMGGSLPPVEDDDSNFTQATEAATAATVATHKSEDMVSTPPSNIPPELIEVTPEEAGFTTSGPDTEIDMTVPSSFSEIESNSYGNNAENETESLEPNKKSGLAIGAIFAGIGAKFKSLRLPTRSKKEPSQQNNLLESSHKKRGVPKKFVIISVLVLLIIIGGTAAAAVTLPRVRIITTVDSQEFNKELPIGISTSGSGKLEVASIPGNLIEASEIGTKRGVATGEKLVGKKASGNVTIHSVSEGKEFPKGTLITSPSGLKFSLSRDATVASGDAVSSATVTVPVEASAIGDSFNLAANTKFSVGSYSSSDYLAKNESAMTGGESHMATVVTKADQDRLMASLSAELSEKAVVDLQNKVSSNQELLPNAITSKVAKRNFSKQIDSEADTFSLDLTMDFQGVVFSKDDALAVFQDEFSDEIPQNYKIVKDDSSVKVIKSEQDDDDNVILTMTTNSILVPDLDISKILPGVLGKNQTQATKLIMANPGVKSVQYEVTPPIFAPIINLALPFRSENVKLEIVND